MNDTTSGRGSTTNSGMLWGGRFDGGPSPALEALSRSTHFDWVLAPYDLAGSRAHARVLAAAGLLSDDELPWMLAGIDDLDRAVAVGSFTAAERRGRARRPGAWLVDLLGPDLGGKLRAGRSRNDQIATLFRLYLRDHARTVAGMVLDLVDALGDQADLHLGAIMPGRTHLQHAQPVLLSHHLLAHAWPLARDVARIATGTLGWPPTRRTAQEHWRGPVSALIRRRWPPTSVRRSSPNSIDGIAARDFVAQLAFVLAMIGVDVSRQAEEIILWATREFGFVRLHDGYSTGSSIMPQKKNPDIAQLAREVRPADRQPGRVARHPEGAAPGLQPRPPGGQGARLRLDHDPRGPAACFHRPGRHPSLRHRPDGRPGAPGLLAGDRRRGVARARGRSVPGCARLSGACVRPCEERGIDLPDLTDADFAAIDPRFSPGVREVLTVQGSVASRDGRGGTAPARVPEQLAELRAVAADHRSWLG